MYKGHCVIMKHMGSFIKTWDVYIENNFICGEGLLYPNYFLCCPREMMTYSHVHLWGTQKTMHRNNWCIGSIGSWVAKVSLKKIPSCLFFL